MLILGHSSRSPISEVPLLEATQDELHDALRQIYDIGLPGFVIRAANAGDYSILTQNVATLYSGITGERYIVGERVLDAQSFSGDWTHKGTGRLHTDSAYPDKSFPRYLNVHRTIQGAGKVMLANSGPDFDRYDECEAELVEADTGLIVLGGEVPDDILSPAIHVAHLEERDITIFPFGTRQHGLTWHRFDTSSPPRITEATIIELARR